MIPTVIDIPLLARSLSITDSAEILSKLIAPIHALAIASLKCCLILRKCIHRLLLNYFGTACKAEFL